MGIGRWMRSTVYGYLLRRAVRVTTALLCVVCTGAVLFGGLFAHLLVALLLLATATVLVAGELP